MMTWPYPGDSPIARARRVAHAYRARLHTVAPDVCAQLDAAMSEWGQHWVVPRVVSYDPDTWLSPAQAADLGGVEVDTVRQWRLRGRLKGRYKQGKWQYRAGDIVALTKHKRTRTSTKDRE